MTRRFIRPGFPSMPVAVAAAVAAVACFALAACTVGPDFKPPQANAPAQWHDLQAASAAAATSASAPGVTSSPVVDADPDPRWWRAFHDPLLDQLVDRAARDNLDVQTAVMRIAEAREQLHQAAAQGLPNVRATASYQREQLGIKGILQDEGVNDQIDRLSAPGSALAGAVPGGDAAIRQGADKAIDSLSSPTNLWQAGFDASWELDLFGRVRRSVEAAGAETGAAVAGRDDALLSLEAEVAQTYLQYRGAQALRALTLELAQSQQDFLDLTRDRAAHGLTSQLDVRSADARLAQIRAQLPQYDQQLAMAAQRPGLSGGRRARHARRVARGAGRAAGAAADGAGRAAFHIGAPASRRAARGAGTARGHGPGRRGGRAVLSRHLADRADRPALHARARARAVVASVLFGRAGDLAADLPGRCAGLEPEAVEGAAAGGGAGLPARGAGGAARCRQRVGGLSHRSVAPRRARRCRQGRGGALDLARDSYRKGIVPYLDVLDAERQWSEARQQALQGAVQTTTDLVSLYKALGGGWQTDGATAAEPGDPRAASAASAANAH